MYKNNIPESAENITVKFENDDFEEIMEVIRSIQEKAYYGDIEGNDGTGEYARGVCYEIDMLCRGLLDKYDN